MSLNRAPVLHPAGYRLHVAARGDWHLDLQHPACQRGKPADKYPVCRRGF